MKTPKRWYWVMGMFVLAVALTHSTIIPELCADGLVCRILDGFFMFLTILFGAALGAALALLWGERGRERQSRSQ